MAADVSWRTEVRHLLWLQGRLTVSAFRRGDSQDWQRIIGALLMLGLVLPAMGVFGVLLIAGYRALGPEGAGELLGLVLTFVLLFWLGTPMAQQQIIESFNPARLFHLPVSFQSLVVASLVTSMMGFGTLAVLPFAAGIVAGFATGIASFFATLLLGFLFLLFLLMSKAVMDDVLNLIAEDRRLRTILVLLGMVPFALIYLAQFSYMFTGADRDENGLTFGFNLALLLDREISVSTYLLWIPTVWIARGAQAAALNQWADYTLWSGLTTVALGMTYALHVRLLRLLYFGHLVSTGSYKPRQHGSQASRDLPALPLLGAEATRALWALMWKDWHNLRRNPMTVRLVFMPIVFALMVFVMTQQNVAPVLVSMAVGGFLAYMLTMMPGHNQFAILDHRGFGTLIGSPATRYLILLSHNFVQLSVTVVLSTLLALIVVSISGDWLALPMGVVAAAFMVLMGGAIGNLTSVYLPYAMDLEKGRAMGSENRTSLLSVIILMIALPILAAPAAVVVAAALVLRPTWLLAAVPVALVYTVGVYALLTRWAVRALEAREERILAVVQDVK